ncbi:hypothetical protein HYQ45_003765 [Verticillium longisporum]|uniref:Gylcosyl hydrolase 115 C-terminal domain-containing protein n=1 Tax=Verticillium longisporum TaxID=100787 RepID=A0A8I2ZUF4_VERLO|nr:hypothetical protein HYQ45_003765 [Verticillium longisporum]
MAQSSRAVILLAAIFLQFFNLPFLVAASIQEKLVGFEPSAGAVEIHSATILYDDNDPVGIKIAVNSLAEDLEQITGRKPPVKAWRGANQTSDSGSRTSPQAVIIAATVDSPLLQALERANKVDVEGLRGKWESFHTTLVKDPLPGVQHALVIAGSDMRGAMFGVYTLSEQSGKSPLHWWADVPVTKHRRIYALDKTLTLGEPSVKFRGIFINDEAPALTGWWANHADRTDYTFDAEFYERVYDLLLRLKANFIWPAMWASFVPKPGRIFFTDDSRSQQLASDYGIVVSTSHHEPMQRASNEWTLNPAGKWNWVENKDNVVKFMDEGIRRAGQNETYFTLGMRGENDGPINAADPIAVLEDVFETQRGLLAKHYGNVTAARQVWTIYKEVATYYAAGLTPPDDVTLMFTDDNWGNVQRLPTEEERKRSGGIGLYYHFAYVGRPKSWKWQNCNNLPKVYKELFQAAERGADRIWVLNVGDIKPLEVPINLAMDLAWNKTRFDLDSLPQYLETLAERDFGAEVAKDVASAWLAYSHLIGMRQFETTEPTTFSQLSFEEADKIVKAWKSLAELAQSISDRLPRNRRDALYHTLLYPALAGHNYISIVLGQGKNQQYGFERRNSANAVAHRLIDEFENDHDLVQRYDRIAGGKWKGIMATPKFDMNVADWRPSSRDVLSNLSFVQLRQDFDYGFGNLGIYVEQSRSALSQGRICASINPSLPTKDGFSPRMRLMQPHGPESRFIELFHRGDQRKPIPWSVGAAESWIRFSKTSGQVTADEPDARIHVSIDWASVPSGLNKTVEIRVSWEPEPYFDIVHLPILNLNAPTDFKGFPETDGYISIEGPHHQRSSGEASGDEIGFQYAPLLGSRSESGSVALRPYAAAKKAPEDAKKAWLEYDIYILGQATRNQVNATVYINGALDTDPNTPMEFSLSVDDAAAKFTRVLGQPAKAGDTPPEWTAGVADHVWKKTVALGNLAPGKHTLRWQANSPEVYLEKIVVGTQGRVPDSYLGPPETRLLE